MKQEAVVTVCGLSFSSYCEKLITETIESNSGKVSMIETIFPSLVCQTIFTS